MNKNWSYVPFSQIIDWQEKSKIKSGDGQTTGKYKMFVCSDTLIKRYDESLIDKESLIFGTGGKACIHYCDEQFTYSTDCVVACKKDNYSGNNLKFYYYYLRQNRMQLLQKDFTGSGLQHTSKKKIGALSVPLPTVEEQNKIVAKIEELFSELDKAVDTLQNIKKQLAVYRQAVLKDAFEGELTNNWRLLNNIDKSWKVVSIVDVIKKDKYSLKAGPFGSSLKKEMYSEQGYKIYGQEQVIAGDENIGDYYVDETKYHELITCKINPGDILISLVGTVGKVLILSDNCKPGIINPRLIKVSLDKTVMLQKFFKYYFESSYLRSLYKQKVHGATMDVLNKNMIKELPFPLCDINEQQQVILEIESRFSVCDNIEKTIDTALLQSEALRQTILKQAFEGELIK